MKLLRLLSSKPGRVFDRKEILDACHDEFADATGTSVSRRVQRLRKKLGEAGQEIITVHGMGYMVRPSEEASGQPRPSRYRRLAGLTALLGWLGLGREGQAAGMSLAPAKIGAIGLGVAFIGGISVVGAKWIGTAAPPATLLGRLELVSNSDTVGGDIDIYGFDGFGSGIDITTDGKLLAVSGSGPRNGPVSYHTRMCIFDLQRAVSGEITRLSATSIPRFVSPHGTPFLGELNENEQLETFRRFDPEGIRQGPTGTCFVADEYGPSIAEFDIRGRLIREFAIPPAFRPPGRRSESADGKNAAFGRVSSRGFTGVAISPDGRRLYTTTQCPLAQDGGEAGRWLRILEIEIGSGDTRQFAYRLHGLGHRIDDLLMSPDGALLLLEQDEAVGTIEPFKRVIRVDFNDASDVGPFVSLTDRPQDAAFQPVRSSEYLNIADVLQEQGGYRFRWPIQGMAFLPNRTPGEEVIVLSTDNKFESTVPTYLFAVKVERFQAPNRPGAI